MLLSPTDLPKDCMPTKARLKPRTLAVRVLYELNQTDHTIEAVLANHFAYPRLSDTDDDDDGSGVVSPQHQEFIRTLVTTALNNRHGLDSLIIDLAPNVPLSDMPLLQRVVLQLAIAEMRYMGEGRGDYKLIINAAVEITRAYVGDSPARFVNGVLGTVALRYPESRNPSAR